MIREEEARLAQEEKQKQKDKLKHKFASFFVAKKRDPEEAEEKSSNGNFKEFRVSFLIILLKLYIHILRVWIGHLAEQQWGHAFTGH